MLKKLRPHVLNKINQIINPAKLIWKNSGEFIHIVTKWVEKLDFNHPITWKAKYIFTFPSTWLGIQSQYSFTLFPKPSEQSPML